MGGTVETGLEMGGAATWEVLWPGGGGLVCIPISGGILPV